MAYAMTVNVPVPIRVKFVDVYANDTTKNGGKGYGSQVAVKGDINGATETIYLKGFTDANLNQLQQAGVIAAGAYDADPAQKYNIPVSGKHEVTLVLEQPAGQRYPKLKISANGAAPPSPPAVQNTSRSTVGNALEPEPYGSLPGDEVETGGPPSSNGSVGGFEGLLEKYGECFTEAAGFAQRVHKMGIPVDLSGISAIAATLYISRKDARV
jgi:hypothetical protein